MVIDIISDNDAIKQHQMTVEIIDGKLSCWSFVNTASADKITNKAILMQRRMMHVLEVLVRFLRQKNNTKKTSSHFLFHHVNSHKI